MILDSDEWKNDDELQKLPTLDILLAFEDWSRLRERDLEDQMRRAQVEKTRKERKAREGFKVCRSGRLLSTLGKPLCLVVFNHQELMRSLVESGDIKARSKWKHVYPLFKDDSRYLNMLGNPGSNPLELFWDVVDGLDQKLDAKLAIVDSAIKKHNDRLSSSAGDGDVEVFKVTASTTKEELFSVIRGDSSEGVKKLTRDDLDDIYKSVRQFFVVSFSSDIKCPWLVLDARSSSQDSGGRETSCRTKVTPPTGRLPLRIEENVQPTGPEHDV